MADRPGSCDSQLLRGARQPLFQNVSRQFLAGDRLEQRRQMIAEDFLFDTSRIKERLGWRPTMTNEEMLWRAYQYYSENRREIESRQDVSAHRKAAKMGVIRLLKWVS